MTYAFNRTVCEGIICFLLIVIQPTTTHSLDDRNNVHLNAGRAKLTESCLIEKCAENLICNENYICQCQSGYKNYDNYCVPAAEENEACEKAEDCCGKLICINGICRKPITSHFATLSKICMGITVTTLIIAVLSTLIKCIIRYDRSRALERQIHTPGSLRVINSFHRIEPRLHEIRDEKPPSYEECIRNTPRSPVAEPPPYVIATNPINSTKDIPNCPVPPAVNLTSGGQIDSATPLNVQALYQKTNSNTTVSQNTGTIQNASSTT